MKQVANNFWRETKQTKPQNDGISLKAKYYSYIYEHITEHKSIVIVRDCSILSRWCEHSAQVSNKEVAHSGTGKFCD